MNDKGLSFAEAQNEALAEFEVTASDNAPVSVDPVTPDLVSPVEQPVARNVSKPSVLEDLLETEPVGNTVFDDSSTVDFEGKTVSIGELKKGYMRQEDYTPKTQRVAEERERNANAIALWEALEKSPVETLKKLNSRVNFGQPLVDAVVKPAVNAVGETDLDAIIERKLQERLASDPNMVALQNERALSAVESEFTRIENSFNLQLTDQDKTMILSKADAMKTTDLEFVFSGLYQQAERKRAAKRNVKDASTNFGYRGDVDSVFDVSENEDLDWDAAMKAAMILEQVSDLDSL